MAITLRRFADSDLDALFTWESDPRAVQMAAFTRANPSDRTAFDAHYERVRSDPAVTTDSSWIQNRIGSNLTGLLVVVFALGL